MLLLLLLLLLIDTGSNAEGEKRKEEDEVTHAIVVKTAHLMHRLFFILAVCMCVVPTTKAGTKTGEK